MNFTELRSWGCLLLGLACALGLRAAFRARWPAAGGRFDRAALLALSLFMLLEVSWQTLLVWVAVTLGTYLGLKWILSRPPGGRWRYLWVLLPLQLAPLVCFKYSDFALNRVLGLEVEWVRAMVIPVGVSFYTLQLVAFVLDTLAFDEPLPGLLDHLNFSGFFPLILAGPIERKDDLLPQMQQFAFRWDKTRINDAASWIVLGLFFKCCLADNLAQRLPPFVESTTNPFMIWAANLLFGLRIYYDFAGYSLMALGVAHGLGVRLTLNFLSPYCATNVQEFWVRWHVALSNWLRDYVFMLLGGWRAVWWAANLAAVFLVSGLWHGAGWNFVAWGALHGLFLMAHRLSGKVRCPAPLGWTLTMAGVFLAWLCFYELRPEVLWLKLGTVFSPGAYTPGALRAAALLLPGGDPFVLGCLLALVACVLGLEWLSVRRHDEPYVLLRRPLVLALLVVLTVLLAPGKANSFIYFAF